jgi:acyl-CoA thioester hydrolase
MEIDDDCHIVVVDVRCRYHASALYDEVIRVRTHIAESRSRTIRFSYEVLRDSDRELLATGETLHVICGSNGKPKLLPEKYRVILGCTPATANAVRSRS